MGDADDSYDFGELDAFLEQLRGGSDLVMGNRFKGGIEPGAMPPRTATSAIPCCPCIGRLFFTVPMRDFHCGMRGFRATRPGRWTAHHRHGVRQRDGGKGAAARAADHRGAHDALARTAAAAPPHLRTWRDGWRHLRFLLSSARAGCSSTPASR